MERRGDAGGLSDGVLVRAMRRHDRRALREFFVRFYAPLEAHAAALGVPREERDELVTEFLDDAALRLLESPAEAPRHLLGYLVRGFRHRVANRGRSDGRRRAAHARAVDGNDETPERPVASTCSEEALRASRGPGRDEPGPSSVRRRIAELIDAETTDEEKKVLAWLGEQVGMSEIGARLGLNRNAAKSRVRRLRRRLCRIAIRYALRADDGPALLDFFRELEWLDPRDRALLFGGEPPPPRAA